MMRLLKHLFSGPWTIRRCFPERSLQAITDAVAAVESLSTAQVRVAIEGSLAPGAVLGRVTARERSMEIFSLHRVWDTADNNGVLIYLLLADRDVHILADRSAYPSASPAVWEAVCKGMEERLSAGEYEPALIEGVRRVGDILKRAFPRVPGAPAGNELPDRPLVL